MKQDIIYVAGALNSDATGYIQNANRMIKTANYIQRMGASVYCPANDYLQGIVSGEMEYEDYFNNTQSFLLKSDALFIVPKSENSEGTKREIELAESKQIPVFYDKQELYNWLNRPIILCISGGSGSGKTFMAEWIESIYSIPMIQSHTDRPKRSDDEKGHTFHSKESFDKFKEDDMIAYTEWEGNRYCCLKNDVEKENTYVIDESGVCMLKSKYGKDYRIITVKVDRPYSERVLSVGSERVKRDKGKFFLSETYYNYLLNNDKGLEEFKLMISGIVRDVFNLYYTPNDLKEIDRVEMCEL